MQASELEYELPRRLIAQHPAARRGASQLMVVQAGARGPATIDQFDEVFASQLRDDDLVVANDTRVLHARVRVRRPGGGLGELLLLDPVQPLDGVGPAAAAGGARWRAMARPGRRLRQGMQLAAQVGNGSITCIARGDDGTWVVELPVPADQVPEWLQQHGELPLPPYIEANGQPPERYQTVYASEPGSVAAPTAGLHFDERLWSAVDARCERVALTLHVGAGTFLPVRDNDLARHAMHAERYEVSAATDRAVRVALQQGRRVVAVGTTTTRVLESVYGAHGGPLAGSTSLFVTPGYSFRCVGAMLTNFHLPRSTLLALVMAFAGVETTRACYRVAIDRGMRFYSFGDAMFVHGDGVR